MDDSSNGCGDATHSQESDMPAEFKSDALDLPAPVTVVLLQGEHKGRPQLWAPLRYRGKDYRLIVNSTRNRSDFCHAGEEWEVWPDHSPNGHMVFCTARQLLKTERGEHPLMEWTKWCVERGCEVTLFGQHTSHRYGWHRSGVLTGVELLNGDLRVTMNDVKHRSADPGRRLEPSKRLGEYVFSVRLEDAQYRRGEHCVCIVTATVELTRYELRFLSSPRA